MANTNETNKEYYIVELSCKNGNLKVGPGGYRDSKGRLKEQFKNPRRVTTVTQPPSNYQKQTIPQQSTRKTNSSGRAVTNYLGRLIFQEFVDPALREGVSYLKNKALDIAYDWIESSDKKSYIESTRDVVIDVDCRDVNTDTTNTAKNKSENSQTNNNVVNFRNKAI